MNTVLVTGSAAVATLCHLFAWCRNWQDCAICWQCFFLWMDCESRTVYFHIASDCTCLYVSFGCAIILTPNTRGQYILLKITAQICHAMLRSYHSCMIAILVSWLMCMYLFSFVYFAKLFDSCHQKYYTKVAVGPECNFGMIATSFLCMICFQENRPM